MLLTFSLPVLFIYNTRQQEFVAILHPLASFSIIFSYTACYLIEFPRYVW